jgi:hypothetical protein
VGVMGDEPHSEPPAMGVGASSGDAWASLPKDDASPRSVNNSSQRHEQTSVASVPASLPESQYDLFSSAVGCDCHGVRYLRHASQPISSFYLCLRTDELRTQMLT